MFSCDFFSDFDGSTKINIRFLIVIVIVIVCREFASIT